MNFLMPLTIGGADMANNKLLLFSCVFGVASLSKPNFVRENILKACYISSVFSGVGNPSGFSRQSTPKSNNYNNYNKNFASYLAGLFEGDGHI